MKSEESTAIPLIARRIHLKKTKSFKLLISTALKFTSPLNYLNIEEGDYLVQIGPRKITKKGRNAVDESLSKVQTDELFSVDVVSKNDYPMDLKLNALKVNTKYIKDHMFIYW